MTKKKMLSIIGITFILIVCFFIGLYILGIKGQAYRVAIGFLDDNKVLLENIGQLKGNRLALFGYSVSDRGSDGHAEYKILVKGEMGKGAVYIELKKSVGIWKVTRGNFISDNRSAVSLLEN